MNQIIINPHNCSREEYQNLVQFLEEECWDFSEIEKNNEDLATIKNSFAKVIDLAEGLIQSIPQKGDTSSECQRIALQNAINEFSYVVNGIEAEDLVEEED